MKKIIHLILLIVSVAFPLSAERFNHINEDQGLSSRRTYSVCQDKNGFIWISTKLSIDRFDGHRIVHYDLSIPHEQTIDNIGFNFVRLAPDQTVWAFTQSGAIFRYNEETDSFDFIYSIRTHYQLYNIILNDIFFDNNNTILLATAKGILRLDADKKQAVNCEIMNNIEVYHILKEQGLYYLSSKTGLYITRLAGGKDDKIMHHLFADQFVNRVYYDNKYQQFWIGTFSKGMYVFPKRENGKVSQISPVIAKPVRSIILYNDTQLAVGVDGEGVLLINRQTLKIENSFVQTENQQYSIGGNSVWDLFLDSQKILWIATYHEGVSYTDRSNLDFHSFIHERNNTNSISNNYINAVLEDSDGDLWFGSNNGVSLFYRKTGKWKHFFQERNVANENVILTLCEGSNSKMWVGGYAFGAAEIDKNTGSAKRYHAGDTQPIVGTDYIYSIYKDEYSGNLWTGGIYGKISCYDLNTKQVRIYDNESLRCFCSYNDSSVLLGLNRGLYLMDIHSGEKSPTKINATVNHILRDKDRSYWIGTTIYGLYYYDFKTDSLIRYTKETHGLSSNHIYAIEKDEEGFLWISTEEGLNKFNPSTGDVITFDKQNGLISNQFTPHASFRCSTSEMLFGTADGGIIFYPSEIKKSNFRKHYPLIFTQFQLFGNPVEPGEKDSPLRSPINNTEKIVLSYNKNYFSLVYTLPNFQSADKTEYSYFLKDYDLDWSKSSANNTAAYSKIQPGVYTFYVRAYIDRQLLDERQLQIVIKQPWWNTVWAWLVYVTVFGFSAYRIIHYFSERRRKKQAEEKMEFFINTAHDILTPLSLIEAPLKDISMMTILTEEAKYLLSLALSNTRKLSHFVHQLLDFQRITLNAEHLVVAENDVYDFFMNKANAYRSVASQKFISLDIHIQQPEKKIYFDKEKINKILDNLLSNAIKFTPFGGKIEILVSYSDNEWSFSVKDNGIGIPQRNQRMIFRYLFREDNDINAQNVGSGVGLKMVQALVRIHQGKITFNSKKDEGTEFTVTLPYHYEEKYIDKSGPVSYKEEYVSSESQANSNILIVESESEMSNYLNNAFAREYPVSSYTSGAEALNQITHVQPALVIVDSLLSDMDGFSFCRKIKENSETEHIPIVIITEQSDPATVKKVFASGANDYIKKPFEFEVLKLKVENLLSLEQIWQNKALADIKKNNINTINNDRDQEFMDNLIQLIEKNLDNPDLNISMLCKELALSRTLLYNKITQLTSISPNEFIRTIRLKTAANLLISGKHSVTEVSTMVGIDNPKYFSRIFKEYYHVSPKNYLK